MSRLYCFPKYPELRKEWADKVKQTKDKWEPDTIIQLIPFCAASIWRGLLSAIQQASRIFGSGKVRVLLKTGAIWTVFERLSPNKRTIHSSSGLGLAAKRRRTAVEKQDRLWCKHTHHCKLHVTGEYGHSLDYWRNSQASLSTSICSFLILIYLLYISHLKMSV